MISFDLTENKIIKMEKQEVKEYLKKQYPNFKGFIDHTLVAEMAMNFANMQLAKINYTRSCETLKAGDTPTFKQWLKLKKIPKVDNLYYYKGTHYFLIEINNIYKEWCRLHL
jgi:hypothetical protein